jgi:hypothetical protein
MSYEFSLVKATSLLHKCPVHQKPIRLLSFYRIHDRAYMTEYGMICSALIGLDFEKWESLSIDPVRRDEK